MKSKPKNIELANEDLRWRLSTVSGSLLGMGALFRHADRHLVFEESELYGLGQLLELLAKEVLTVEKAISGEP